MCNRFRTTQFALRFTRAAVAAGLCSLMIAGPALAEDAAKTAVPRTVRTAPLTDHEKVLHALNRLTFGPRPGDEAAVSQMGLEAWFQQQLHPAQIDDSALDRRLDAFPAMKLSLEELTRRFPSPQVLRQISQRGGEMPSDPQLRAVYLDAEAAYAEAQKRQAAGLPPEGAPGANNADPMMQAQTAAPGQAAAQASNDPMMATPPYANQPQRGRFAGTPMAAEQVEAIISLPPAQRMQKLLALSPQQMMAFRAGMSPIDRPQLVAGLTPAQMETILATQGPIRVVGAEALDTRLLRDVYSDRQLQAVMTDFWLNHFNVYLRKNQNEPYLLPAFERDTILPNALGKFENLLVATAQSPAMLVYLDNWQSVGPDTPFAKSAEEIKRARPNGQLAQFLPEGINENYARELMELHTLGVNGGYTQKDVQEVAKVFTGWTLDRPYQGGGGGAIFDASRHEGGDKFVLGHTIHSNGQKEGLEVLHILATSPATAHFISSKLAVRFVSDEPPQALVDRMADTFLKTGGDIKAVLTTMFHSPEFWAPENYRAKVKTPIEFMVSALRASGADVRNPQPLVQAMDQLGMPIFGMQTPNGYSWKADEWVSTNALIARMNFSLVLSGGRLPGTLTNWPVLLGAGAGSNVAQDPTPATETELETLLLGEPASARTRDTVLAQFANPTAQQAAEQNFNQRPASDPEIAGEMAQTSGVSLQRASARRDYGQRGYGQQFNRPETPLDTMAGLLLGSPDFQRR
jgi:hypothetical protein